MDAILYEDEYVTLTSSYITLNRYYFPLATSKTIMFTDIESVEIESAEGVDHRWGICTKYLNNWFSLDSKRAAKKQFIAIKMKNRNIKPSFTPNDVQKIAQLIWENHTPQGREELERRSSQVGKETEVAQQEIMDRMKEEQDEKKQQDAHETTENELGPTKQH